MYGVSNLALTAGDGTGTQEAVRRIVATGDNGTGVEASEFG